MSDTSSERSPVAHIVTAILIAGIGLVANILLARKWSESVTAAGEPSMLLPLFGACIALAAGVVIGTRRPRQRAPEAAASGSRSDLETVTIPSRAHAEIHTDETPTVSALMEEEHIPGAQPASIQTPASSANVEAVAAETVARPPTPSVAIDDRPRDEAMSAKDEVIRSLENIVKENRDKWADFEQDRDDLEAKIKNLQSELRIAHQIIEHGGDENDVFVPPQVLSRV